MLYSKTIIYTMTRNRQQKLPPFQGDRREEKWCTLQLSLQPQHIDEMKRIMSSYSISRMQAMTIDVVRMKQRNTVAK